MTAPPPTSPPGTVRSVIPGSGANTSSSTTVECGCGCTFGRRARLACSPITRPSWTTTCGLLGTSSASTSGLRRPSRASRRGGPRTPRTSRRTSRPSRCPTSSACRRAMPSQLPAAERAYTPHAPRQRSGPRVSPRRPTAPSRSSASVWPRHVSRATQKGFILLVCSSRIGIWIRACPRRRPRRRRRPRSQCAVAPRGARPPPSPASRRGPGRAPLSEINRAPSAARRRGPASPQRG